jgi:hypothetical protein
MFFIISLLVFLMQGTGIQVFSITITVMCGKGYIAKIRIPTAYIKITFSTSKSHYTYKKYMLKYSLNELL